MTISLLTCNFGNYDLRRNPASLDSFLHYVYLSDENSANPIRDTYHVRYHPFDYVPPDTDAVLMVDASMQIKDSLSELVEAFIASGKPIGVLSSRFLTDEEKILYWKFQRNSLSDTEARRVFEYMTSSGMSRLAGTIGCGCMLCTREAIPLLDEIWNTLLSLSDSPGTPVRTDEIVLNKKMISRGIAPFLIARQLVQSRFMQYCRHGTEEPLSFEVPDNYPVLFGGRPVTPYMPGEEFNREYSCFSEAMLLTRYLDPDGLAEWLDWHLGKVGFDRVHVFDNESAYDVQGICERYGNRVTYELVTGVPRQYPLYDRYANSGSSAEWLMPLDDDEYLDIGDFRSVADAIRHYRNKFPSSNKLAFRWKHMFPKKFHSERTGGVLGYCTEENPELAKKFIHLGDNTVKTMVRRYGRIHYEETRENPAGGHVPANGFTVGATMCDGRLVTGCGIGDCPDAPGDERVRVLHCRYKGYSEYKEKMGRCLTVSDGEHRAKRWAFDGMLETLE